MDQGLKRSLFSLCCLLLVLTVGLSVSFAKDSGIAGWEVGSEYNKLYNPKERDTLKGRIVKFVKVTPLPGMATGTALYLDEGDGEKILVHICPASFASARDTGLRRGEKVKVKGAWADIGEEDVFIAAKIKKDSDFDFKVRLTSDGTPFWTMSAEQLAKERASD